MAKTITINERDYANIMDAYNIATRYLSGMRHKYNVLADEETNKTLKKALRTDARDVSDWLESTQAACKELQRKWAGES